MTEKDFVKEYKKAKDIKTIKAARENVENFWNTLFEVLKTEDKVVFKDWGVFERKEVKSRKIVIPTLGESYTEPKVTVKFRAGKKLRKFIDEKGADIDE